MSPLATWINSTFDGDAMNIDQHVDILYAYIVRLSFDNLQKIVEAERHAWRAQLDNGTSGQIAESNAAREVVRAAVSQMLASDRATVEAIIHQNVAK